MKKKILTLLIIAAFTLSAGLPAVYAGHGGGKCPCQAGCDKGSLEGKIYKKAQFLKMNQKEIGLSDEQVKQLMDLKRSVQKKVIAKDAEIETLAVDIMANLYEKPIDVAATNKLVEAKYEIKKAKTLELVQAMADLKNILTDAQYETMKELWVAEEKMCKK